jgi:crossover junction endodeoxyribonuclease RusA
MQEPKNSSPQNRIFPEILLSLYFPIPPNTNHAYRRAKQGGMYMTDEGQGYKASVARVIRGSMNDFTIPKKTPLVIHFEFYLPSNRLNINDWDGLIKLLQDAIFETGSGNDAWIRHATIKKYSTENSPNGTPLCWVQLRTQEQEG